MSPEATCPRCGKVRVFHEDELRDVKKGIATCTECGLEVAYLEFLTEVLDGEHSEVIAELRAQVMAAEGIEEDEEEDE